MVPSKLVQILTMLTFHIRDYVSVLLRSIHETGKAGNNCFTSIQRITAGLPDGELKENPAFAFKVDLVRLLGNLCWKHKERQDQVSVVHDILLVACFIFVIVFIFLWIVLLQFIFFFFRFI